MLKNGINQQKLLQRRALSRKEYRQLLAAYQQWMYAITTLNFL
jgi:hypothetical protein